MMRVSYFDPQTELTVETHVTLFQQGVEQLRRADSLTSGR
jgi:hypothetical protein